MRFRFGDFSFDVGRRLLRRGVESIHLSPKTYQLLALLVGRRPDAVGRTEILETLWPDSAGSDRNLASIVSELRHALGESARGGTWVRTLHGFGYAFQGEAKETPGVLRHVLVRGRREVELSPGANVLGRGRRAAVRIGHLSVAREQARIVVSGDQAELEDLARDDSTFRGEVAVRERLILKDGDVIRVGDVVLAYRTRPGEREG